MCSVTESYYSDYLLRSEMQNINIRTDYVFYYAFCQLLLNEYCMVLYVQNAFGRVVLLG